jgi:hypothetical protein
MSDDESESQSENESDDMSVESTSSEDDSDSSEQSESDSESEDTTALKAPTPKTNGDKLMHEASKLRLPEIKTFFTSKEIPTSAERTALAAFSGKVKSVIASSAVAEMKLKLQACKDDAARFAVKFEMIQAIVFGICVEASAAVSIFRTAKATCQPGIKADLEDTCALLRPFGLALNLDSNSDIVFKALNAVDGNGESSKRSREKDNMEQVDSKRPKPSEHTLAIRAYKDKLVAAKFSGVYPNMDAAMRTAIAGWMSEQRHVPVKEMDQWKRLNNALQCTNPACAKPVQPDIPPFFNLCQSSSNLVCEACRTTTGDAGAKQKMAHFLQFCLPTTSLLDFHLFKIELNLSHNARTTNNALCDMLNVVFRRLYTQPILSLVLSGAPVADLKAMMRIHGTIFSQHLGRVSDLRCCFNPFCSDPIRHKTQVCQPYSSLMSQSMVCNTCNNTRDCWMDILNHDKGFYHAKTRASVQLMLYQCDLPRAWKFVFEMERSVVRGLTSVLGSESRVSFANCMCRLSMKDEFNEFLLKAKLAHTGFASFDPHVRSLIQERNDDTLPILLPNECDCDASIVYDDDSGCSTTLFVAPMLDAAKEWRLTKTQQLVCKSDNGSLVPIDTAVYTVLALTDTRFVDVVRTMADLKDRARAYFPPFKDKLSDRGQLSSLLLASSDARQAMQLHGCATPMIDAVVAAVVDALDGFEWSEGGHRTLYDCVGRFGTCKGGIDSCSAMADKGSAGVSLVKLSSCRLTCGHSFVHCGKRVLLASLPLDGAATTIHRVANAEMVGMPLTVIDDIDEVLAATIVYDVKHDAFFLLHSLVTMDQLREKKALFVTGQPSEDDLDIFDLDTSASTCIPSARVAYDVGDLAPWLGVPTFNAAAVNGVAVGKVLRPIQISADERCIRQFTSSDLRKIAMHVNADVGDAQI